MFIEIKENTSTNRRYKMKYVTKSTNIEFKAIMARRNNLKGVMLSRLLKSGKLGKPQFYQFYGGEKTAQEVIERLQKNNPSSIWVEA